MAYDDLCQDRQFLSGAFSGLYQFGPSRHNTASSGLAISVLATGPPSTEAASQGTSRRGSSATTKAARSADVKTCLYRATLVAGVLASWLFLLSAQAQAQPRPVAQRPVGTNVAVIDISYFHL